jgi:hypothetical protein
MQAPFQSEIVDAELVALGLWQLAYAMSPQASMQKSVSGVYSDDYRLTVSPSDGVVRRLTALS